MKVFVADVIPEVGLRKLKERFDVFISDEQGILSKAELIKNVSGVDAIVSTVNEVLDKDVIDACKKLKVISNMAVGYNNIDVEYATKKGIMVTNTPGVLTDTTADLTWSLLMAISRRIVEGDTLIRSGKYKKWRPQMLLGSDIYGKTIGIVGFGRIGQQVAKRASGFDMKVLYYDIFPISVETEKMYKATRVELDTLLMKSDYVTLHTLLTKETHHLINEQKLSLMKSTAYLINASRGPVIDEKVLVKALQTRQIAGAALDVYENEPELSTGLAELDNVVLLPHLGSATQETRNKMAMMAADNAIAALSGETPPNLVNKELDRK
jgi:glyoxylate reductase